jgi:hypothetical protein
MKKGAIKNEALASALFTNMLSIPLTSRGSKKVIVFK